MKHCKWCAIELTTDNQYQSVMKRGELQCNRCRSLQLTVYRKAYYQLNKERFKEKNRIYRLQETL